MKTDKQTEKKKFNVRIEGWGSTLMEGDSIESLTEELKRKFTDRDVTVKEPTSHKLSDTELAAQDAAEPEEDEQEDEE